VANAKPFMDFTIDTLTSGINLADPRVKSEVVARIAPLLQQIPDRIIQGHYISVLAKRLGLEERLVLSETRRTKLGERPRATRSGITPEAKARVARRSTEDYVVALLLRHPDLTRDVTLRMPIEELTDARNREIVRILREEEVATLPPEQIVLGLDDHLADHAESLLDSLRGRPEQFPGQIQREANQMLMKLGKERFDFLMKQLDATLQTALQDRDTEAMASIKEQIGALAERHRQYYPPPSPYFLDTRSPQSR
jgi:DNA primase